MAQDQSTDAEPVLSESALLQSMIAALNSLEEKKRSILTPEMIEEFLTMLYDGHFASNPSATEKKIHEFITAKIEGANK
jgi:hypothetical protein